MIIASVPNKCHACSGLEPLIKYVNSKGFKFGLVRNLDIPCLEPHPVHMYRTLHILRSAVEILLSWPGDKTTFIMLFQPSYNLNFVLAPRGRAESVVSQPGHSQLV